MSYCDNHAFASCNQCPLCSETFQEHCRRLTIRLAGALQKGQAFDDEDTEDDEEPDIEDDDYDDGNPGYEEWNPLATEDDE